MNILYIPSWYPTADNQYSGSFIRNLAKDVACKDFRVTVVFLHSGIFFNNNYKEEIGVSEYLREYYLQFRFLPKGLPILQNAWINTCVKKIARFIDIEQFDIIHSHGFIASFIGSKISTKYNKPHFVSYHYMGFILNSIPKWRLETLKHNNTSVHICPSTSLASALNNKINVETVIIPNYFDIIPRKKKSTEVKNDIRCLSVMYFEKVKNPIGLIQEFAKLPDSYYLDIIGDGELKKEALLLIGKLNLSERIQIIPTMRREFLLQHYKKYDLFISSSKVETFGMCLLEAIASGIPVISVSHDGPSDFVHKKNGILSSMQTLKDDIIRLVKNDIIKNPIAISQTVDRYRKVEVIPKYLELYQAFANI